MENYLKVESDTSLVRDMNTNAIINQNKSEYDKFLNISRKKYEQKIKFDNLKSDVDSMKTDINEIKTLLKQIVGQ
tara:strand:+ start:459 stop:683 length:225 start_codon:yes stop_codon:yes gene_type:complete